MNAKRLLTLCVTLIGLTVAAAGLRAETHRLIPTVYYNMFSSACAPALRIKSGDRVVTTTVDDLGIGADGKTLAKGPNPQTGPFYIEGAEPGDLIVVTIEKLEPNRTTGSSSSVMAPKTFDAGGLANNNAPRVPWVIDKAKGVVRLDLQTVIPNVDWRERFVRTAIELPLRPMLASLGVAPPASKGAADAAASGPFGGNLDFSGLTAGAKVMLPVYEPGALLFLGHGLARQGDGGVTGTGIETSMDVEFSVDVVKKKEWPHSSVARPSTVAGEFELMWPRVETNDDVMAIGSGPSLLEAFQHATTELDHWLDDDFGFSERSVAILLGPAIEYEIASGVAPNFTVVAKMRKSYLPRPVPEKAEK